MELLSSASSVCLTGWAADIKHYWIFAKTWAAGFWNLIQLMKAVLKKLWGEGFKCFKSLGWNESGFIRSPKHFMAIREKGLELKSKHQSGSQSLAKSRTFEIHFLKLISISKIIFLTEPNLNLTYSMILWGEYHPFYINKCIFMYIFGGERGGKWEKCCIIGLRLKGSESRSERCFNESDVMKGRHIFKDIHILIGLFRSSFHLLLSASKFFH